MLKENLNIKKIKTLIVNFLKEQIASPLEHLPHLKLKNELTNWFY